MPIIVVPGIKISSVINRITPKSRSAIIMIQSKSISQKGLGKDKKLCRNSKYKCCYILNRNNKKLSLLIGIYCFMKTLFCLLVLSFGWFVNSNSVFAQNVAADSVKLAKPYLSSIYAELGGNGIAGSINYERFGYLPDS